VEDSRLDPLIYKLKQLLAGTNFTGITEPGGQMKGLLDVGRQNVAEAQRLKEFDPERLERIQNTFAELLSAYIQPLTINKFGNTRDSALYSIIAEHCIRREIGPEVEIMQRQFKQEMMSLGLNESQVDYIYKEYVKRVSDLFPHVLIEYLVAMVRKFRYIPSSETDQIISTLALLFKEAACVNSNTNC